MRQQMRVVYERCCGARWLFGKSGRAATNWLAETTKWSPSNGMSSSASRISDLVRNFTERVLLGLGKGFFVAFAIDRDEVNYIFFLRVEINYTGSTTPADSGTGKCHTGFPKINFGMALSHLEAWESASNGVWPV